VGRRVVLVNKTTGVCLIEEQTEIHLDGIATDELRGEISAALIERGTHMEIGNGQATTMS
jgi:hypothetical protein